MSDSQVEEIKSKLNVVDVIADYVQLKKAGVNFRARCPFHGEKTPSFYVSPARQIWHCFGCGLGGDIFEFIKQIESMDFPGALEKLADRAGVALKPARFVERAIADNKSALYALNDLAAKFYHKILLDSPLAEEARRYLEGRKFKRETIESWQIGYAPDRWDALFQFLSKRGYSSSDMEKAGLVVRRDGGGAGTAGFFDRFRDRVMFPIRDLAGRTVGFSARILHPREGVGKYINSPESPIYSKGQVLFGLYQARIEVRRQNLAVIVEGNVDVVKSHQAGITNVVASSGTALTEGQLSKLSRLTENLTFAFDADQAGAAAARRALEPALVSGFNVRLTRALPGLKDADEIIDRDPKLWPQLIGQAESFLDFYFHKLFDILDRSDPLAKKAAVEEFLSLLALVSNPVVSSHYVHLAAQAAGVKEQVVLDSLKRHPGRMAVKKNVAAKPKQPVSMATLLEQRFIGLLLADSKMARFYIQRHSPEDFTEQKFKELFEKLSAFLTDREVADLEGFFSLYPEYAVEAQQAALAVEVGEETENPASELRELSKRLRLMSWDRKQQSLAQSITAAEAQNRAEDRQSFMRDYNEILKNIQDIENDRAWH